MRATRHLRHKPEVISGLLTVFVGAVETTIHQRSPGAPNDAHFGAVAFVHRFGSYLNSQLLARSPPQGEFGFDRTPATTDGPEMDQTAGQGSGWE